MFFLPLLLLLQKLLITAGASHTSRLNLPLTEHAVQAHDTVASKGVVDSLELMAKVEAMAAKMEKMEEMFVRREEEMRLVQRTKDLDKHCTIAIANWTSIARVRVRHTHTQFTLPRIAKCQIFYTGKKH